MSEDNLKGSKQINDLDMSSKAFNNGNRNETEAMLCNRF